MDRGREPPRSTRFARWGAACSIFFAVTFWLLYPWKEHSSPNVSDQTLQDSSDYHCDVQKPAKRVAIVGAGSGGSSAAYYIQRFRDPCRPVNVTVYERSSYVGGRSTTVNVYDNPLEPVELGASIFVKVNRNLVDAVDEFGLSLTYDDGAEPDDAPQVLGIWNGEEFVFTQSDDGYSWLNLAKIVWKYGFMNVYRNQALMRKTVGTFLRMYEQPYFPFQSLSQTAFDLGLTDITTSTGSQFLEQNGVNPPFSTEIVQASTRVNYAQNLDQIHGLETMVCMAIEGQMSVKGGNWQIFDGMLKASKASLLLNTSVAEISLQEDATYTIKAASLTEASTNLVDAYDSVIIAAPLQFSNITITPTPPLLPSPIPYVTLHVTLFASPHVLSPTAFNLPATSTCPSVILTTLSPHNSSSIPFFSISTLRSISNPSHTPPRREYVYKIFSPAPVTASFLANILGLHTDEKDSIASLPKEDVSWHYVKVWHSYPYLPPRVTFDDPQLDAAGTLWYTSGIEGFISTMETSSLMGMNVAKLVVDGWELGEEGKAAKVEKVTEGGDVRDL